MAADNIKSFVRANRQYLIVIAISLSVLVPLLILAKQLTTFDRRQDEHLSPRPSTAYVFKAPFGANLSSSYVIKSSHRLKPFKKFEGEPIVIATNFGSLRGLSSTYEGRPVAAFLGVPYAEPPLGESHVSR